VALPDRIVYDPDPRASEGDLRVVGYSPGPAVLT
jgi:hypothetical protein